MLFYFVFHFLKNCNDVYVMYCLPVGCNNKKYKLQKISLAVLSDGMGSCMRTIIKENDTHVKDYDTFNNSITGRHFMWANKSSNLTIFPLEIQLNIVKAYKKAYHSFAPPPPFHHFHMQPPLG